MSMKRVRSQARKLDRKRDRAERYNLLTAQTDDLAMAARDRGLQVQFSVATGGKSAKSEIHHWIFRTEDGAQLLHYWPVNGSWWAPGTGERDNTLNIFEALEIACKLACVAPSEPPSPVPCP